jgi:putative hydrolase
MAEDPQPGPADDQPEENEPEPYRLGGSGGAKGPGQSPGSGGQPDNPLEALFSSLAGGDINAVAAQLQSAFAMLGGAGSMFAGGPADAGSGVNWEVTKDTARKTTASLGPDPSPSSAQQRALTDAVSLAELWLDEVTSFPRVSATVAAWSRAEWIEQTLPVWRRLVEPVAAHIADAMEGALSLGGEAGAVPGMAGMEQMLRPMLRTSGASMFGLQLGQGLGQLATEVVGATDIGLPLSEPGHVALLPTNVAAFGKGLEQSGSDVTLYLALRECARQRLFAAAGWLREQMLALVEQYAAGITIDTSALEQAVGQFDPANMEELSSTLEGALFAPQQSAEQKAVLQRLETMLALVEGWVDEVVSQATEQRMPAAAALAETVRRVRATGGPAEATFATLVGLELRPRRMRDAANLWAALRDARGAEGRDAVWSHPDLIPTSADLDDPLGFASAERDDRTADHDFDAALAELLDRDDGKPADDDPR